jgi:hypothetical protein
VAAALAEVTSYLSPETVAAMKRTGEAEARGEKEAFETVKIGELSREDEKIGSTVPVPVHKEDKVDKEGEVVHTAAHVADLDRPAFPQHHEEDDDNDDDDDDEKEEGEDMRTRLPVPPRRRGVPIPLPTLAGEPPAPTSSSSQFHPPGRPSHQHPDQPRHTPSVRGLAGRQGALETRRVGKIVFLGSSEADADADASVTGEGAAAAPPRVRKQDILATTEEELDRLAANGSVEVRGSLAWTAGEDPEAADLPEAEGLGGAAPMAAPAERFDLMGRRILTSAAAVHALRTAAATAAPTSASASGVTDADALNTPVHGDADGAEALVAVAVAAELVHVIEDAGSHSRELYQHESEAGRAGYSLVEALELARSMVSGQRTIGWRLFAGVLLAKEAVASAAAYTHMTVRHTIGAAVAPAPAPTPTLLPCAAQRAVSRVLDASRVFATYHSLEPTQMALALSALVATTLPAELPMLLLWKAPGGTDSRYSTHLVRSVEPSSRAVVSSRKTHSLLTHALHTHTHSLLHTRTSTHTHTYTHIHTISPLVQNS